MRVVVIATGPSLTLQQIAAVRRWHRGRGLAEWLHPTRQVYAVNDSWLCYPDADVVYSCDTTWWARHKAENLKPARQAWWSINSIVGVHHMPPRTKDFGSGLQAVRVAEFVGASDVALLGFDWGAPPEAEPHWFGEYPQALGNCVDFGLAEPSIFSCRVVNCTPGSRLEWYPKMSLQEWLDE